MRQTFLMIAFLLMPMIALADYELDQPEVDIEEFRASCIQSTLESTGRLNASELSNLEASCVCYADVLDFLFSYEDFLVNTEDIIDTFLDPLIEVCSTRLSLASNE